MGGARARSAGSMRARRADRSSDLAIRGSTTARQHHRARRPSEAGRRPARDHRRRRGGSADARLEINTFGNVAEDARRTGDWDWALGELETAPPVRARRRGEIVLRPAAMAMFRIMRGEVSDEALDELAARLATLDDRDVEAGKFDLRGPPGVRTGRVRRTAADAWIKGVAMSDYNVPYILPRVAVASSSRDARTARRTAIGALIARGTRGRVDRRRPGHRPRRASRRSTGDREAAARRLSRRPRRVPRPRRSRGTRRSSRSQAATTLGAHEPEVAGWVDGVAGDPHPAPCHAAWPRCSTGSRGRRSAVHGRAASPPTPPIAAERGPADRRVRAGRGARGSRPGPRVSITRGSQTSRALKITCCAPASESSPNQSMIWAGVSPGRSSVFELHGLERRALDLVGVAADRLAVLAQDLVLVVDPLRVAEDVARVGVLRDEPERLPLAAAADHDRRAGPRDRLRRVEQPASRGRACPRTARSGAALARPTSRGRIWSVSSSSSKRSAERREREPEAARLLLVPGGADARARRGRRTGRRASSSP